MLPSHPRYCHIVTSADSDSVTPIIVSILISNKVFYAVPYCMTIICYLAVQC